MNKLFQKRLAECLSEKNISATKLASITNISKSTISRYLSGKYIPKEENLVIIADVLNVNYLWLLGAADVLLSQKDLPNSLCAKKKCHILSDDEIQLIAKYRKASKQKKVVIKEILALK